MINATMHKCFVRSFFVIGMEETKNFLSKRKDIDVYMLYIDKEGKLNSYATDGIRDFIQPQNIIE